MFYDKVKKQYPKMSKPTMKYDVTNIYTYLTGLTWYQWSITDCRSYKIKKNSTWIEWKFPQDKPISHCGILAKNEGNTACFCWFFQIDGYPHMAGEYFIAMNPTGSYKEGSIIENKITPLFQKLSEESKDKSDSVNKDSSFYKISLGMHEYLMWVLNFLGTNDVELLETNKKQSSIFSRKIKTPEIFTTIDITKLKNKLNVINPVNDGIYRAFNGIY